MVVVSATMADACYGACFMQCDCGMNAYAKAEGRDACPCVLHPCPNFEFCHSTRPLQQLHAHEGRCIHCNMCFGVDLQFLDGDCPVCLQTGLRLATLPRCTHSVCLECLAQFSFAPDAAPAVVHAHTAAEQREQKARDDAAQARDERVARGEATAEEMAEHAAEENELDEQEEETERLHVEQPYRAVCPLCRSRIHRF